MRCSECSREVADGDEIYCDNCGDPLCAECWEKVDGICQNCVDANDGERDADPGDMDGDHETGLASAGFGTDEDYGGTCEEFEE